jgi:tol-pal system protein YbgF
VKARFLHGFMKKRAYRTLLGPALAAVLALVPVALVGAPSSPIGVEEIPFQAPVIDEEPRDDSGAPGSGEDVYRLQVLQEEMKMLRGLVEELQHQIKVLGNTQGERYLEVDRRLQDLRRMVQEGNVPSGRTGPDVAASRPDKGTSQTEKSLYDTALELMHNRQYDLAITQLQALITQFPDGGYTANAYYWLGEVHAAKPEPDYEQARQALEQVVQYFSDSRKVPDAMFKLGKVYHLMGDCDRATELLQQVISGNEGRSVAKLASDYLSTKVSCNP